MKYYEIDINNDNWSKIISKSEQRDIHFEKDYFKELAKHYNGKPKMIIFEFKGGFYAIPYIKRKIKDSGYFDIISSWYYGGPIYNFQPNSKILKKIESRFNKYCLDKKIISAFFYLHPYEENQIFMFNKKNIFESGKVIFVDTSNKIGVIKENFSKSRKGAIKKSYKSNDLKIVFDNSDDKLESFFKLYNKVMEIKEARKTLFFEKSFFKNLKRRYNDGFLLVNAIYKKKIIAMSLFLKKYNRSYYYLSARKKGYNSLNAPSRIIFEMILHNLENDVKYLDLGGGHLSLQKFKSSFSNNFKIKKIYKKVFNNEIYKKLCKKDKKDIEYEKASFFPEYRRVSE